MNSKKINIQNPKKLEEVGSIYNRYNIKIDYIGESEYGYIYTILVDGQAVLRFDITKEIHKIQLIDTVEKYVKLKLIDKKGSKIGEDRIWIEELKDIHTTFKAVFDKLIDPKIVKI